MKFQGFETKKKSRDAHSMKDLVDMLAMFMLQVVEKDGNLYPSG
jgi:hypothetical protein